MGLVKMQLCKVPLGKMLLGKMDKRRSAPIEMSWEKERTSFSIIHIKNFSDIFT
jgi:hypothetical protein